MPTFSQWLSERLARDNLTPADLARRIQRSPSAVYQWLSGETSPNDENVRRLSRVLRVDRLAVYQALGKLRPPEQLREELASEALAILGAMPPQTQELAIQLLRDVLAHQEAEGKE
jgi:transcriptional regulator with XRE-family HTH domain